MQSINRRIDKPKNCHKGFTVLELLVASLLLGMLMTILTMIFSQSSIAWRTGVAGTDATVGWSEGVAEIRSEADNIYPWEGQAYRVHDIFDNAGKVLTDRNDYIKTASASISVSDSTDPDNSYNNAPLQPQKKPSGVSGIGDHSSSTYIVNVMSYGPDRKEKTRYDNVYSVSPSDDPDLW